MSFGEFAKKVGKSAAKSFLDEYDRASRKTGGGADTKPLRDYLDGKVDFNGNPIEKDDDDY